MRSRAYQNIKGETPTSAVDIPTAVAFLKEHSRASFDETVEIHVHLGIDPNKSEQTVRGTVTLPAGAAKQQKIVVFTSDPVQQKEALTAGARQAGGEELIDAIATSKGLDADITIATPELMPQVAKIAKILGPKGLMPSPKTGTVTPDPVSATRARGAGQMSFKMDKQGNIHASLGKISWDQNKIINNIQAFLEAVRSARPAAAKGEFFRSLTLKSTMSPSIRITRR